MLRSAAFVLLLAPFQDDLGTARGRLISAIEKLDETAVTDSARQVAGFDSARAVETLVAGLEQVGKLSEALVREERRCRDEMKRAHPDPRVKLEKGQRDKYDELHRAYLEVTSKLLRVGAIRTAIAAACANLKSEAAIAALVKRLSAKDAVQRATIAEALGHVRHPAAVAALEKGVSEEKEPQVKIALVDALAVSGNAAALARALSDPTPQVRLAATRALARLKAREAVEPLIEALKDSDGLARSEMNDLLVALTGVDKHGDPAAWKSWWEQNGAAYRAGTWRAPDEKGAKNGPGTTTFYGVPVASKRVVFVLDISNSMHNESDWIPSEDIEGVKLGGKTKLDVAKYELKRTLLCLPGDAFFNIIFFHHAVWSFDPSMQKLDRATRLRAFKYVDDAAIVSGTDIHEALKAALGCAGVTGSGLTLTGSACDTIFLISDGKPHLRAAVRHVGTEDPNEILKSVRGWNKHAKVVIHCVGISARGDAEKFLRTLAEENGGTYVKR